MTRGRWIVALGALVVVALAAGGVAALWPSGSTGSAVVRLGTLEEVVAEVGDEPMLVTSGRNDFWLVAFPVAAREAALRQYPEELREGVAAGLVALRTRSPHLGEDVRWCPESGFFQEGEPGLSAFNPVGEKLAGPAPRGLDHFRIDVVDGEVRVLTDRLILLDHRIRTDRREPADSIC